jgi:hypothetical protein
VPLPASAPHSEGPASGLRLLGAVAVAAALPIELGDALTVDLALFLERLDGGLDLHELLLDGKVRLLLRDHVGQKLLDRLAFGRGGGAQRASVGQMRYRRPALLIHQLVVDGLRVWVLGDDGRVLPLLLLNDDDGRLLLLWIRSDDDATEAVGVAVGRISRRLLVLLLLLIVRFLLDARDPGRA